MSAAVKKYTCRTAQFCSGGAAYGMLEILWRGYTHISMIILGGMCFMLLIRISKSGRCLATKALTGGFCITAAEFVTGCLVNLWLGLSVWDYSKEPCQFMGQVCLRFSVLWILLCLIIIPLCEQDKRQSILRFIARRFSFSRPLRRIGAVLHVTK